MNITDPIVTMAGPRVVMCCAKEHRIIEWSCKAPRPFGAECSVCGKRVYGTTYADVITRWKESPSWPTNCA